jgi:hypothetical protein
MVKTFQLFQPQVRDNLQQAKQRNFSSKASSSPRFRFSKHFPLSPGNSTQWILLLPKEEGLIQVYINDHPPIPLAQKIVFHLGNFLGSKLLGPF